MNGHDLAAKVHSSMYLQCKKRGYATPVDVLQDIGILRKEHYENWRYGRVPYLEKACTANLSKLSLILREMRLYAQREGLKPSYTLYKQWALKGRIIPLRFSKSGRREIERQYSTHYIVSNDKNVRNEDTLPRHPRSEQSG